MTKTNQQPASPRPRRMARAIEAAAPSTRAPSKLDQVVELIRRDEGASIAEIAAATGWQHHSVRGAMAGALKKRGLSITSAKVDGTRRYRVETADASR